MPRSPSPLRYPGGKTVLYPVVARIMRDNRLEHGAYAEPFAGGCGLALSLLYEAVAGEIHINDLDASIWAFWESVLNHTDEFCYRVRKTPLTVEEWHRQREVHLAEDASNPLALGFATFYLNRTNRSGVIKAAGIIGGLDQDGPYKMDCRFNREELEKRIRRISSYRSQIFLTRMDAIDFMNSLGSELPDSSFFCIDPPYYKKGRGLYTSFYMPDDHAVLAENVLRLRQPSVTTYDNVDEIRQLYKTRRQYEFDINYSLHTKRKGTELLIPSKGLRMPAELKDKRVVHRRSRAA